MNLAVRGLQGGVRAMPALTTRTCIICRMANRPGATALFAIANPPFNGDEVDAGKVMQKTAVPPWDSAASTRPRRSPTVSVCGSPTSAVVRRGSRQEWKKGDSPPVNLATGEFGTVSGAVEIAPARG